MAMGDKPSIIAQDAQRAAAIAAQAVAAADQATGVVNSIPGVPSKGIVLHVLAGVGVAAGAVTAVATLGLVPGLIVGGGAVLTYVIGWLNPTPAAVSAFGAAAK